MPTKHLFHLGLHWNREDKIENPPSKRNSKNHSIHIAGKPELQVSAAKSFKGDASIYNPEDLLLSSLTSCHMMSYLYCCQIHGIEVVSYSDQSEAILEVNADGSGRIVQVNLFPIVSISDASKQELALNLHKKANELCFIANSCNFPVLHSPICNVEVPE